MKSPAPPSPPSSPASPLSDRGERPQEARRPGAMEAVSEDTKPLGPQALEAANFRGLLSLKQMQERSFSLVNQALLRQKLVREEQIKIERDTAETENNNDTESVNNNSNSSRAEEQQQAETISFEEARRRFLTCDSSQPGGRLAFSVENILAPGKFGREHDEDQDQFGEFCLTHFYYHCRIPIKLFASCTPIGLFFLIFPYFSVNFLMFVPLCSVHSDLAMTMTLKTLGYGYVNSIKKDLQIRKF